MVTRAVVIKTVGDKEIGAAIVSGLTAHIPKHATPGEKSAAARKREYQVQKLAQFRAAAIAQPKRYEVPLALIYLAISSAKERLVAVMDAALRLPGCIGRFFRKLLRLVEKDSHMPWGGLVGTALAWGLSGAIICKVIIAMKYFW